MDVKINKEIRDYSESMFFGLSLRQFVFSVLACGIAVLIYFRLEPLLGLETTSWICIVAAFPFALIGFLKYNGMTAEQFIWAWIKDVFLTPKVLTIGNSNFYYDITTEIAAESKKRKPFHRRGTRQKRKTVRREKPREAKTTRRPIDTRERR
ncbi:MAG: PrgI family protein [Oscillospiraceae bacterium]|nr:PrgI family protein [Oscillospiraceae bacterium]